VSSKHKNPTPEGLVQTAAAREALRRNTPPIETRLWGRCDKSGECWLYLGTKGGGGYGHISQNGRQRLAHRVSYELAYGPIPEGMDVLHRCDTPACVRPDHLFLGTHSDNIQDMLRKGRRRERRGEESNMAKLNADAVLDIRATYGRNGVRLIDLAQKYNVHLSLISLVVRRKIWQHID